MRSKVSGKFATLYTYKIGAGMGVILGEIKVQDRGRRRRSNYPVPNFPETFDLLPKLYSKPAGVILLHIILSHVRFQYRITTVFV